ncbi:MAG: response regulator [Kiritimatiellaeota bacterium]|nr:response regulator [Kiritimatiellota bacterium]
MAALAVLLLATETGIMILWHKLGISSALGIFLAPLLLALVAVPLLYLLVFRPLQQAQESAEEARQETRQNVDFLKSIMDSVPDKMMVVGPDRRVLLANRAVRTEFGQDPSEAGLCCHQVSHQSETPCDGETTPCPLQEVLKTGAVKVVIHEHPNKDGEMRFVEITTSPVWDAQGKITSAIEHCRDVTQRVQVEQKLKDAIHSEKHYAEKAQAASSAKTSFLANMSHEIRTPMNAVIGMTDLLMETDLNPEQRESANIIRTSGEALMSLINEVLDFSKIESGHMELEQQDFDLSQCIEGSLDLIVPKAAEKDIELVYEIDGNVPTVIRGDTGRLRQILLNLLSNAVKFTHEGEICVSVTARRFEQGHEIEFSIRDTGIGIEPDQMEKIFKEFTQADISTTRQYGGTGLGLTISRKLSELMGGRMWAESVPGEGATFHFTLCAAVAKQVRTIRRDQTAFDVTGYEVLIVDDNETNLKILSAQLHRWGLTPTVFNTPESALESIEKGDKYALMITDMQMPKMDGTMLISEVRKHRAAKELPIIVLTSLGLGRPDESLDISAYLTKPTKPAQLYQNISNILRGDSGSYTELITTVRTHDNARPLNILVTEDNLLNQKVAMRMLEKLGYKADLANDGMEAVEMIEKKSYDLVLMDIQMPRMDGLTATKEIIKHFEGTTHKRPLVVGMTAHAAKEERERGLAAGMDDYLTKPIQLVKLKGVLWKIQVQNG